MYAGLSGVMYALSIGSIAPESFGLELSILYLAMIVLGGLGSVGRRGARRALRQRAAAGLPAVRRLAARWSAGPVQGGLAAGQAARFLFGLAIVLVVLFEPAGLAGLAAALPPTRPGPGGRPTTRSAARPAIHQLSPVRPTSTREHAHEISGHRSRGAGRCAAVVVARRRLQHQGPESSGRGRRARRRRCQDRRRGIEGNDDHLGVLTDLTGVFAALGKDITNANTLYWEKQNAGNKVCDKYDVKLDVKDTGYVAADGRPALQRR